MTNYQRTAAWLKAAGKEPKNTQHISVQLACHFEEIREQVELVKVSTPGAAEVMARIVRDLEYIASAGKEGRLLLHVEPYQLTEFLKELCDGKITADGVAYQIDAECFRWWVHEAAENPVGVAKAIAHCITEDEYRTVIVGAKMAKDAALKQAMESKP